MIIKNHLKEVLNGNLIVYHKKIFKKRLFLWQMGDNISSKKYHPSVFWVMNHKKFTEL